MARRPGRKPRRWLARGCSAGAGAAGVGGAEQVRRAVSGVGAGGARGQLADQDVVAGVGDLRQHRVRRAAGDEAQPGQAGVGGVGVVADGAGGDALADGREGGLAGLGGVVAAGGDAARRGRGAAADVELARARGQGLAQVVEGDGEGTQRVGDVADVRGVGGQTVARGRGVVVGAAVGGRDVARRGGVRRDVGVGARRADVRWRPGDAASGQQRRQPEGSGEVRAVVHGRRICRRSERSINNRKVPRQAWDGVAPVALIRRAVRSEPGA